MSWRNGTAAWGARIYGDGRRAGDRVGSLGRVVVADSTGEQRASDLNAEPEPAVSWVDRDQQRLAQRVHDAGGARPRAECGLEVV